MVCLEQTLAVDVDIARILKHFPVQSCFTLAAHLQQGYGTWFYKSVCLSVSVCYHVFCYYAQQSNEIAIPTGFLLLKGHFHKTSMFKSLKTK